MGSEDPAKVVDVAITSSYVLLQFSMLLFQGGHDGKAIDAVHESFWLEQVI